MVLIVDFFIGGAMILFGRQLTAAFVSGVEQTVIEASYPYLLCGGAMMWVLGLLFVYRFSLQSLGDTVVPMLSGALELILRISVVLVLSKVFNLGFLSICIAEVSAWFGAGGTAVRDILHSYSQIAGKTFGEIMRSLWQKQNVFKI